MTVTTKKSAFLRRRQGEGNFVPAMACVLLVLATFPVPGHAGTILDFMRRNTVLTGHLVTSHSIDVATSPVDASRRLFHVCEESTTYLLERAAIRFCRFPVMTPRHHPVTESGAGMDLKEWERALDSLTGSTTCQGKLNFLIDGEEFFPRFIDAIKTAQSSVMMRTYIFDNDDFAIKFADMLKNRSSDIDVFILLDRLGTLTAHGAISESLPADYRPPRLSTLSYLKRNSRIRARSVSNVWLTTDHTKYTLVDSRIAFLGGMNIGREYRYDWHDIMVELQGSIVTRLRDDYYHAWNAAGLRDTEFDQYDRYADVSEQEQYPIRLLYTKPGVSQIYEAQLAAIRNARQYIYIENSYFADDTVIYELCRARNRGVDVRVIIAEKGDIKVMERSNIIGINTMIKYGIKVYLFPRMSHVKAAVYDGWACLGSANFDKLSLRINDELNIATSHPKAVRPLLEQVFEEDFRKSRLLTEPLPVNVADYVFELLADEL